MTETLESWLGTRSKWLQTAAANILSQQVMPDSEAIEGLADLCVSEVKKGTSGFSTVPLDAFGAAPAGAKVRIKEMKGILGVNALDGKAALDLGNADLVVVYGPNGTGKSGFARLVKHAAGARLLSELLPNAFEKEPPKPAATFVIERDGELSTYAWSSESGSLHLLKNVHIFDTRVADHYMKGTAEARYEPRRLRFLSSLVVVCDHVKAVLVERQGRLGSKMPAIPGDLQATDAAVYVSGLKATLKPESVTNKLARGLDHEKRAKDLDVALLTEDPAKRIAAISKALLALGTTAKMVTHIAAGLSDETVEQLTVAKALALSSRVAANDAAKLAFDAASLSGVGESTWRAMWDAARLYATETAYPGCAFPHVDDDAKCPLCQQDLAPPAQKRLAGFESYVQGQVESEAKAKEAAHDKAVKILPVLSSEAGWNAQFAHVPEAEITAKAAWAAATARRAALTTSASAAEVPVLDLKPLLTLVTEKVAALEQDRELVTKAQEGDERAKMEAERRQLRMLDWCHDNRAAILNELGRLKTLAILKKAVTASRTKELTIKKGELAQHELTGGYQDRFAAELRALGAGRIKVQPVVARNSKGKITFKLAVVGAEREVAPADMLSEGERRIAALASFLADVTVAGARTPFIFDDPISSLDSDFEEKVVARLVELAKTRQVLVFTHRLSLLSLLSAACDGEVKLAKVTEGATALSFKQIGLHRLGGTVGCVTESNVVKGKVKSELISLISGRLAAAKELEDAGKVDEYAPAMKAICSEIRILTELAVEHVLLGAVVVRFRRGVMTKDKLHPLVKITSEDCIFLDDLMTRFSVYEHSQSDELPTMVPGVAAIVKDAEALKKWVVEFPKRKIPAS